MELSTFITVYVIVGVVISMCVLGMTVDCVEVRPSRSELSIPLWFIGAIFCGIIWPLTCALIMINYFHILLNRRR